MKEKEVKEVFDKLDDKSKAIVNMIANAMLVTINNCRKEEKISGKNNY